MIRINLLGDDTKLDYSNRYIIFGFVVVLLISSFFCYRLYSETNVEVRQLTLESERRSGELKRLQEKTKLVRQNEEKKNILKEKLIILAKLRKNRVGPVRVLDDLNISMPDSIWIRSLSEGQERLDIVGRALDNQNIALFIQELQKSDYFLTVDLIESRQVYYSKKSGQVSTTPDFSSRYKGGKNSSKYTVRNKSRARRGQISENNVRIKEFTLAAAINYAGDVEADNKNITINEGVEFPELKELENL